MIPVSNQAADLIAAAPLKFTPTEDFFSEEFKSQYTKGLEYTLRNKDSEHWAPYHAAHKTQADLDAFVEATISKLATCMETWLNEKKIVLVDPQSDAGSTASARIVGFGAVT